MVPASRTYNYTVDYSKCATTDCFGNHWDFNFNIRLDEIVAGQKIILHNGQLYYLFTKNENDDYIPPANATEFIKMVKNEDDTYTLTKTYNEDMAIQV